MNKIVDIEVILDDRFADPKITIQTKEKSKLVEDIIEAVENISGNDFPNIPGLTGDKVEYLSQREIVRVYTSGRKLIIQTDDSAYFSTKTLSNIEAVLNPDRFIRISQSEIVNMRKVKQFEMKLVGTIGLEFENGEKTWVSRSSVKTVKAFLKKNS